MSEHQADTKNNVVRIVAAALVAFSLVGAGHAVAAIRAVTDAEPLVNVTHVEDFESFASNAYPGEPFDSGGFTFDCADCQLNIWAPDEEFGMPTQWLYQNGGSTSMTTIALTSGADFRAISLDVASGWAPRISNYWVRAYNNGSPVASFVFNNLDNGSTVTIWTDGDVAFDEVRVQGSPSPVERDENQHGAVAIDNVVAGRALPYQFPIPSTGTFGRIALVILLGAMGLLLIGRRRNMA